MAYFRGRDVAYAIEIGQVTRYKEPQALSEYAPEVKAPPQSYVYRTIKFRIRNTRYWRSRTVRDATADSVSCEHRMDARRRTAVLPISTEVTSYSEIRASCSAGSRYTECRRRASRVPCRTMLWPATYAIPKLCRRESPAIIIWICECGRAGREAYDRILLISIGTQYGAQSIGCVV